MPKYTRCAAVVAAALFTAAPSLAEPFTYQGRLDDGGSGVTGLYDFEFVLFNAASAGSQILSPINLTNVQVTDGLFSVSLDFGPDAFLPGQNRFLEITVSPAGSGNDETLSPRQEIDYAPRAGDSARPWTEAPVSGFVSTPAPFVGVGRSTQISGNEAFGIRTNSGATYGGMYIQTDNASGWPFYGYTNPGGGTAWTYLHGPTNEWRVWNGGDHLMVTSDGRVGIGAVDSFYDLNVVGSIAANFVDVNGSISHNGDIFGPSGGRIRFGGMYNTVTTATVNPPFSSIASPNILLGVDSFTDISNTLRETKRVFDGSRGIFLGGGGEVTSSSFAPSTARINWVADNFGTVAGGVENTVGSIDGDPTTQEFGTISGGLDNTVSAGYGTIGGGQSNTVTGSHGAIAGGFQNSVLEYGAAAGGQNNDVGAYAIGAGDTNITGNYAAAFGRNNETGSFGLVSGDGNIAFPFAAAFGLNTEAGLAAMTYGESNQATGDRSFAGGFSSRATGEHAVALGRAARANGDGSFVFADNNNFTYSVTGNNAFAARFTGGYTFVSAINGSGTPVTGARLLPGAGSWTTLSDVASKADFAEADHHDILEKVTELPTKTWRYVAENESIRHLGPTAQDFHEAFGLGGDPKGIDTVDADGVALASIKALNEKLDAQSSIIEQQQKLIEALEKRLSELEEK